MNVEYDNLNSSAFMDSIWFFNTRDVSRLFGYDLHGYRNSNVDRTQVA